MIFLKALLLFALMAVTLFAPGYYLVRRLRWSDHEKIPVAVALSVTMVYLVATAVYLLKVSWYWCWLGTAGAVVLTVLGWPDLLRLFRKGYVRRQFAAFGCLLLLTFLLLSLVRHYSGGGWAGDWLEHYERVQFFLDRSSIDRIFLDLYLLPARPPLFNVTAAFFMAQAGKTYDLFQLCSMVLNLLVFFPCILLASVIVKYGARRVWTITAFLGASHVVLQNSTWTWTKLLAAFFVILSIALYLRSWRLDSAGRMIAAAGTMAAGIITHYSAGPFALFLALHYPFLLARRRHKLVEILGGAAITVVVLGSWFFWSMAVFGTKTTFGSNTTVTDSEKLTPGENIMKIGRNVYYTLVPGMVRLSRPLFETDYGQPNRFGYVRDRLFYLYQQCLPATMGSLGWLAVLYLTVRQLARARWPTVVFWGAFIVSIAFIGIAVHGALDVHGVGHVSLQPLTVMGITLLGAAFVTLPRWARVAVAVAVAVDLVLAVVLQFRIQMHLMKFPVIRPGPWQPFSDAMLSFQAMRNAYVRQLFGFPYWADHFARVSGLVLAAAILMLAAVLFVITVTAMKPAATNRARVNRPSRVRSLRWRPAPAAVAVGLVLVMVFLAGSGVALSEPLFGYVEPRDPEPPRFDLATAEVEQRVAPQREAVAQAPHAVEPKFELALAYYNLGQFNPAANHLIDAFLLDPKHPRVRYLLGTILMMFGQKFANNDARFAEYVRLNPDDPYGRVALAGQIFNRGHIMEARQRMLDLLARHPDSAHVHIGMAQLAQATGLRGEAVDHAERAFTLEPTNPDYESALRTLLGARGDTSSQIDRRLRDLRQSR